MSRALASPSPDRRNARLPGAPRPYDALALGIAQRLDLVNVQTGATRRRAGERTAGPAGLVLLVTSARPGEGKSFIVGKLARRLAWVLGEPVAVVDANAERPGAGAVFKVAGEGLGLFASIARGRLLPDQFQSCRLRDVFVMTTRAEGRGSLLTRVAPLARVLDDCRRRHALTILDGGCLGETGCLTQLVDGSLLVVDASRTRRDAIQGALAMPQIDRSQFIGVALNRQPRDIPDWLYRRLM